MLVIWSNIEKYWFIAGCFMPQILPFCSESHGTVHWLPSLLTSISKAKDFGLCVKSFDDLKQNLEPPPPAPQGDAGARPARRSRDLGDLSTQARTKRILWWGCCSCEFYWIFGGRVGRWTSRRLSEVLRDVSTLGLLELATCLGPQVLFQDFVHEGSQSSLEDSRSGPFPGLLHFSPIGER